jgi:hypothetical protein
MKGSILLYPLNRSNILVLPTFFMFHLKKKKVQNQEAHPSMTGFLSRCHQRPGQVSLRPQLAQLAQLALAALEPLPLVVWVHLT